MLLKKAASKYVKIIRKPDVKRLFYDILER